MKQIVRRKFQTLKLYSPYQDVLAYFLPVFSVVFFGYFFANPMIREMFVLVEKFHMVSVYLLVILLSFAVGKVLSDLTGYALVALHIVLYWLMRLIYKILSIGKSFSLVQRLRALLKEAVSHEPTHLSEIDVLHKLKDNEALKMRYSQLFTYANALQTTLGALIALFFMYQGKHPFALVAILVLVFVLTYGARKHLYHFELEM